MLVAIQQVIQTATRVLEGQLTSQEGVTILATMTREAVPAARRLRIADPERADAYHELIVVIGRELRRREADSAERGYVHAVTDDLARVMRALE